MKNEYYTGKKVMLRFFAYQDAAFVEIKCRCVSDSIKEVQLHGKWTLRHREQTGGLAEKGTAIEKCRLVVQDSHGDVKNSTGSGVSNVAITMYSASWVLHVSGGTLGKVCDCLTLTTLCTTETNTK